MKLNLDWRVGIATKDWDSVAKKEKLEVMFMKLGYYAYVLHFGVIPP